jgi:DNA mismatch endonuclease (patch repair protein)
MRGNRSRDTRPEVALRSALHRRGLRFRKHAKPLPDLGYRVDVVFPRDRLAVEVDGCFWHGCPTHGTRPATNADYWTEKIDRNVARDRARSEALESAGWMLLRVWEHEDATGAAGRIAAVLAERRAAEAVSVAARQQARRRR